MFHTKLLDIFQHLLDFFNTKMNTINVLLKPKSEIFNGVQIKKNKGANP